MMSAFDRFAQEAAKAIAGETEKIGKLADYIAGLAQEAKSIAADRDACRRVLAHLDPDLLDSLAIALAADGDNNHALQLAAAARELRALESKEE